MLTPAAQKQLVAGLAVGIACICAAPDAAAQSTAQFPIQFEFIPPGARSMAMGGAFVGAADDATAAFTNPAGLAVFGTRQVAIEGRFKSIDTRFLAGGRISGVPTGNGIDTVATPIYETDVDRNFSPSFVAVVLPVGLNSAVAVYGHELVSVENSFYSRGVFQRATFFGVTDDGNRDIPLGGTRKVRIANYGVAFARKWRDDHLALGGGVSVAAFHVDSQFARHGFVLSIFGPDDPTIVSATAVQTGDDVSVSANVGALWAPGHGVSIGAAYRRGPRFEFTQTDRVFASGFDLTRVGRFKTPDVWAAGVAWTVSDQLRLLFDVDRVQYSQLKRDFIDFQAISSGRQDQLHIDDGTEVHGGVEYRRKLWSRAVAFRGGAWFDPDHTVRYEPTPAADEIDTLLAATLPGGKNLVHYTFGGGLALFGRSSLDVAGDLSSQTRHATASIVFRF
jgi:long-chain fatty acid transport protein